MELEIPKSTRVWDSWELPRILEKSQCISGSGFFGNAQDSRDAGKQNRNRRSGDDENEFGFKK